MKHGYLSVDIISRVGDALSEFPWLLAFWLLRAVCFCSKRARLMVELAAGDEERIG